MKLEESSQNKVDKNELAGFKMSSPVPTEILVRPDDEFVSSPGDGPVEIKPHPVIIGSIDVIRNKEQFEDKSFAFNNFEGDHETLAQAGGLTVKNEHLPINIEPAENCTFTAQPGKKAFAEISSCDEQIKSDPENSKFICNICDQGFKSRTPYIDHVRKHEGKLYSCQTCDKMFSSRSGLSNHKIVHTGKYSKVCDICQKGFYQKRCYIEHMQRHTGNYEWNCDLCQKGFTEKRLYKNHMLMHEGIYFQCKHCDKRYTSAQTLERHMEHHTGNYRFKCHVCLKGFARADYLKRHVKNVH